MKLYEIALTPVLAIGVAIFAALSQAGSVTWIGGSGTDWNEEENWSTGAVPSQADDVVIDKAKTVVDAPRGFEVNSLSLAGGARLNIGSAADRPGWTVSVAGNLTVSDKATLYAYAQPLSDLSVFADQAAATAALFAQAAVVQVGGTFSVSGGATVYPFCDHLTGNPVFFRVNDFMLASDGTFDVRKAGWRLYKKPAEGIPTGGLDTNGSYSYGFGSGNSYTIGGGYGGWGGGWSSTRGLRYGTDFAPFLSGSPSGLNRADNANNVIAAGAMVVFASGSATVAGTVNANGQQCELSGCSGGSVWIAAKNLSVAPTAALSASTAKQSGTYKGGGGGRISLADNVTDTEIAALAAASELPAGYASHPIVECSADVAGAGASVSNDLDGTATYVTYCGEGLVLDNAADKEVVADGLPLFGVRLEDGVAYSVTAPEYAADAADPENVRYAFAGYVLSNATSQIAAETTGRTPAFTPNASEGPYSVLWKWGTRENRVRAVASGDGVATVNGEGADAWIADGASVTLTATPASGKKFLCWLGDIPNGFSTDAEISYAPASGGKVTAVFADATGATAAVSWTGGAGTAFWDDAANWSSGRVPTADDDVAVGASALVFAPRGVIVHSLEVGANAKLRIGGAGTDSTAATAVPQDASETATRFLYAVGDVSNAGQLVLGGVGDAIGTFVTSVGGDFLLSGASSTAVCAARGQGDVSTPGHLYEKRTNCKVGGDIVLSDTAVLYPVCDPLTGTAVFFDADNVTVGATARIDAKGLGYGWQVCPGGIRDARALATIDKKYNAATGKTEKYQTFGPGAGRDYSIGAGYGGKSLKANATYGNAYGSEYAPLMPGSPGGQLNDNTIGIGGGVIWLRAAKTLSVDGTLDATGTAPASGGAASGGGIWLLAGDFAFGAEAAVLANAGTCNYGEGVAGGGRVSLGSGMTDEALAEIAILETLTEDYLESEVVECVPNVNGTRNGSSNGYPGTATRVSYVADATFLALETDTAVDAAGLVWTTTTVGDGESVSVTAPEYGYLSANPQSVRYACAGYELHDADGLVKSGEARTCAFTAVGAEGPYRLVFKWANPEHRFHADKSSGGASTICVNGVASDAADLWLAPGTAVTLVASAADGFRFAGWIGDVPEGFQAAASVAAFVPAAGAKVTALFQRTDGVLSGKTWAGAAMARWDDAANWSPAGVPTLDDAVTVGGTAFAPRGIVAGTLEVGAEAKVFLATKDDSTSKANQDTTDASPTRFLYVGGDMSSAGRMILGGNGDAVARFVYAVGGNLTLSGTSVTAVFPARAIGEVTSNALAAARTDFTVGGKMTLADAAVLYPDCDLLTGTAVRFGIGALEVGASAKIDATGLGYGWQRCPDGTAETKDPRALFTVKIVTPETNLPETYQSFGPGTGLSYEDGAGHGGTGGYWNSTRHQNYGNAYDRLEAPVMPGSPNGVYNQTLANTGRGGGVIWFSVDGRAGIAGALEAKGAYASNFGGSSGGSIFLAAHKFAWSGNAALAVSGSGSGYNAQGAGGRIALAEGLPKPRLATLEATGVSNLKPQHLLDVADYTNRVPAVSVDISPGGGPRAMPGSFRYLEQPGRGMTLLMVR